MSWLPGNPSCLVAGMGQRYLRIFDIRGEGDSWQWGFVMEFTDSGHISVVVQGEATPINSIVTAAMLGVQLQCSVFSCNGQCSKPLKKYSQQS